MRIVVALSARAWAPDQAHRTAATREAGLRHAAATVAPLLREHEVVVSIPGGLSRRRKRSQEHTIGDVLVEAIRNEVPRIDVVALPISPIVAPLANEAWSPDQDATGHARPRSVHRVLEAPALAALADAGVTIVAVDREATPVVLDALGRPRPATGTVDPDDVAVAVAEAVDADAMLFLTDVDAVYLHFGTDQATPLRRVTVDDAEELVSSGTVPVCSMGSKLLAARRFADTGGFVVIAAADDAMDAMRRTAGTRVVRSGDMPHVG